MGCNAKGKNFLTNHSKRKGKTYERRTSKECKGAKEPEQGRDTAKSLLDRQIGGLLSLVRAL